jgi:hypothetical protein
VLDQSNLAKGTSQLGPKRPEPLAVDNRETETLL